MSDKEHLPGPPETHQYELPEVHLAPVITAQRRLLQESVAPREARLADSIRILRNPGGEEFYRDDSGWHRIESVSRLVNGVVRTVISYRREDGSMVTKELSPSEADLLRVPDFSI